jgi:hypothetical protein
MPLFSAIVGGSLFAHAPSANDFALETNEFAVMFNLRHTVGIHLPLAPQTGTSVDWAATLVGRQALGTGYADFGGQWFVKVWYDGTLDFTAGSVLIPSLPASPIRLKAPFTFSGILIAYQSDPSLASAPVPWFKYVVTGAGHVTARLTAPIGPIRNVTSYFYQFT